MTVAVVNALGLSLMLGLPLLMQATAKTSAVKPTAVPAPAALLRTA
jgi:hypothetical protein